MKILSYILVVLVATVPMLWIEGYTPLSPVWWTVTQAWIIGNCLGYLEGIYKKKKEKTDEE